MSYLKSIDISNNMPDTLIEDTITAQEDTVTIELGGHKSCSVTISGTWTGTLVVESSTDEGTTWVRSWLQSISAVVSSELLAPINSFTENGAYSIFIVAGITGYRVRATTDTAWTGTATIKLTATEVQGPIFAATSMVQGVITDPNNSSTTNLDAGNSYTFTGIKTLTLGAVGLQWSLKCDKDATVYVDQSKDGTNWDISDEFEYIYSKGGSGGTIQSVSAYWRIRVILTGTVATTYFRLLGKICPMVEVLPRALNEHGRLNVCSTLDDSQSGIHGHITPFGRLKTSHAVRTAGTAFSGTTKDTNFWTETVTGSGTVTQSGQIILSTGTTANSTAAYVTVFRARHVAGTANELKFTGRLSTALQADNVRRCGVYDTNDGFFFQVNGTTFGVGSRKGAADTIVNSGSFNGNWGDSLIIDTTMGNFVIWYYEKAALFFVNGRLLHTIQATTASLTNTLSFPVRMENINSNGNVTDNGFEILVASIVRFGDLHTSPKYSFIGTNATAVLKYGAGILHRITVTDNSGTLSVYDNTAASGTVITSIDASKTVGTMEFDAAFSLGLTVVSAGTPSMTVIYE